MGKKIEALRKLLGMLKASEEEIHFGSLCIKYRELAATGLCTFIHRAKGCNLISYEEHKRLEKIIRDNVVSNPYSRRYYFEPGKLAPRIEYVEDLIKKYQKEKQNA